MTALDRRAFMAATAAGIATPTALGAKECPMLEDQLGRRRRSCVGRPRPWSGVAGQASLRGTREATTTSRIFKGACATYEYRCCASCSRVRTIIAVLINALKNPAVAEMQDKHTHAVGCTRRLKREKVVSDIRRYCRQPGYGTRLPRLPPRAREGRLL
jgi:hypothetical protein